EEMEWMPNLGLLQIAACLPDDIEVEYIDEEYLSPEERATFPDRNDFDIVGLSVINAQASRAYQLADGFRARGIPVALGGIHPTAVPEEALQHADHIFLGEAEDTFPQFIEDFRAGRAKRIYSPEKMVDLTSLPPARLELMRPYIDKFNRFPIQVTRGCPRQCDFCFIHKLYGPLHRHKNIEQVTREIKMLQDMVDDPFISFADENMMIDFKFSKELVRALIPLNIVWEGFCDISIARDTELLDLLRESGCATMLIGLESLDAESLSSLNLWKGKQVKNYREAIKKIQDHGIGVTGLFIVGFDEDDYSVFRRLRDFARETELFDMEVSSLCPFPGTKFWNRLESEGRILTRNWDRYTWIHVNFQTAKMTPDEVLEGLLWLFREMTDVEFLKRKTKHFHEVYKRHYMKLGIPPKKVEHRPGLPF
ncbi:MAG: B12-binding domain-containing radical SAM protein, partial [Candidatus Eremiobacteraeota bacterium]|nr:B12-binding domain-containing radical SAM protein [Candidatus Eremiobacteraeota bacterium]